MQTLAGVAFLALLISAWLIGTRLLLLARRTRALPEAALGAMLLCMMGLGYPLAVLAQAESLLGLTLCKAIQAQSNALVDAGLWLPLVFTRTVFRPDARWARVLVVVAAGLLGVHFVAAALALVRLERMADAVAAVAGWAMVPLAIGVGGFLWSAWESLRYRSFLARRDALGLGETDPVVRNRLLLFALLGIVTAAGALSTIAFLWLRIDVLTAPIALGLTSATGLAQALLLWLAFLPPRGYRAWVVAQHAAGSRAARSR